MLGGGGEREEKVARPLSNLIKCCLKRRQIQQAGWRCAISSLARNSREVDRGGGGCCDLLHQNGALMLRPDNKGYCNEKSKDISLKDRS